MKVQERLELFKKWPTEEILTEEDLKKLLENGEKLKQTMSGAKLFITDNAFFSFKPKVKSTKPVSTLLSLRYADNEAIPKSI